MLKLFLLISILGFLAFWSKNEILTYSCNAWSPGVTIQIGNWSHWISPCQVPEAVENIKDLVK